jgi:hypothetical protein
LDHARESLGNVPRSRLQSAGFGRAQHGGRDRGRYVMMHTHTSVAGRGYKRMRGGRRARGGGSRRRRAAGARSEGEAEGVRVDGGAGLAWIGCERGSAHGHERHTGQSSSDAVVPIARVERVGRRRVARLRSLRLTLSLPWSLSTRVSSTSSRHALSWRWRGRPVPGGASPCGVAWPIMGVTALDASKRRDLLH